MGARKCALFWKLFQRTKGGAVWFAVASPRSDTRRGLGLLSSAARARFLPSVTLMAAFGLVKKAMRQEDEEERLRKVIARADWMYDRYMIDVLYDFLLDEMKRNSHPEILWRLARVTFEKGKCCRQQNARMKLFSQAMLYINEALRVDGHISAVHKWYAILLDANCKDKGAEQRLKSAKVIREHLERAVELDPNDATSWYILGVWFFTFADLPWYRRRLASIMKYRLPEANYKMALDCFLMAERISTNFYSQNLLMIGKTYMRMGQYELAKKYLSEVLDYVVVSADDKNAYDEATELLMDKNVANAADETTVSQ